MATFFTFVEFAFLILIPARTDTHTPSTRTLQQYGFYESIRDSLTKPFSELNETRAFEPLFVIVNFATFQNRFFYDTLATIALNFSQ